MKKLSNILFLLETIFLPIIIFASLLFTALSLYIWLDDELGEIYLNLACLFSAIEIAILLMGIIYAFIDDIKRRKKLKFYEKILKEDEK